MRYFYGVLFLLNLGLFSGVVLAASDNEPTSVYDKLELKNGDVIQGINGQPINDPKKAFEMISELKQSASMQIERDGEQQTVHIEQSAPKVVDESDSGDSAKNARE